MTIGWSTLLYVLAAWGAFDLLIRLIFRVPLGAGLDRLGPHPARRHVWHVFSVDWNLLGPQSLARAVCKRRGCRAHKSVEFPGANLTLEAARQAFPTRSYRA